MNKYTQKKRKKRDTKPFSEAALFYLHIFFKRRKLYRITRSGSVLKTSVEIEITKQNTDTDTVDSSNIFWRAEE